MQKPFLLAAFIITIITCSCNNTAQKTITFTPLSDTDFNSAADSSYFVPHSARWQERKRIHDSCMGSEFPANAMFMRKKDTFRLGTIINKKTMKVVETPDAVRIIGRNKINRIMQMIDVVTKPCYERLPLRLPVDSFFNRKITLAIAGETQSVNDELNNVISHSINTNVQMGSWLNGELNTALGLILDTTTNPQLLDYKAKLLDPDNIVLIRTSAITDFTFNIYSPQALSLALQKALKKKPYATIDKANFVAHVFYIDENNIELTFQGMFQAMGQFMKCSQQ